MVNLFQRKGSWWINYRWNGQRYRMSTGTSSRKLAEIKLKELEIQLFNGNHHAGQERRKYNSTGTFFNRYLEFSRTTKSASTNISDIYRIKQIQEYFARKGIKHIESITPGEIQLFQSFVMQDHNARSYNNYLGLLKSMLNKAVEWGIIDSNPIKKCKALRIIKRVRYFSKEEIEKLKSAADPDMRLIIDIAVNTGLRRAELYYLRWKDIDLKRKLIHVRAHGEFVPKGKKPGTAPINTNLMKILSDVYPMGSSVNLDDNVFPRTHRGKPVNPTQIISIRFCRLARKARVINARFHDCRHTFASALAQAGVPLLVIKELMRHSDIQSTMIYAHLTPGIQRDAVENLPY